MYITITLRYSSERKSVSFLLQYVMAFCSFDELRASAPNTFPTTLHKSDNMIHASCCNKLF